MIKNFQSIIELVWEYRHRAKSVTVFSGKEDGHSTGCLGGGSAEPDGWRDTVWRSEWASLFLRGGFHWLPRESCLSGQGWNESVALGCPPEAEPLSSLLLLLFWWKYPDKSKLRREDWFCLRVGGLGLDIACHTAPTLSSRRLWMHATAQCTFSSLHPPASPA